MFQNKFSTVFLLILITPQVHANNVTRLVFGPKKWANLPANPVQLINKQIRFFDGQKLTFMDPPFGFDDFANNSQVRAAVQPNTGKVTLFTTETGPKRQFTFNADGSLAYVAGEVRSQTERLSYRASHLSSELKGYQLYHFEVKRLFPESRNQSLQVQVEEPFTVMRVSDITTDSLVLELRNDGQVYSHTLQLPQNGVAQWNIDRSVLEPSGGPGPSTVRNAVR